MPQPKKKHPPQKTNLHLRNVHRERYNFKLLIKACPVLAQYVQLNPYGDESIDFFNPDAVKTLNKALLQHYYQIDYWDIPPQYLCPPIPGRADYIHNVADLLAGVNNNTIPAGSTIKCLDIGVGANCVYPIIGHATYGWDVVGADTDPLAVASANKIIELNPSLKNHAAIRLQPNPAAIFKGIIQPNEQFDVTICNPPFHASPEEAQASASRKLSNLKQQKVTHPTLNFGGQHNELWCEGGEATFITTMIGESKQFAANCFWFTTLVSKQTTLKQVEYALLAAEATAVKIISMSQGNKTSRMVAWTFLTPAEQQKWAATRWKKTEL